MRNIVLSIKPEYVENIISGTKKYEYRTKAAKGDINKIIIYETVPVKKIIGEAEIVKILKMPPNELWELSKNESGTSKEFFDSYFKNREFAYAYKLGKIKVYKTPKTLDDFGLKYPPQSFAYID